MLKNIFIISLMSFAMVNTSFASQANKSLTTVSLETFKKCNVTTKSRANIGGYTFALSLSCDQKNLFSSDSKNTEHYYKISGFSDFFEKEYKTFANPEAQTPEQFEYVVHRFLLQSGFIRTGAANLEGSGKNTIDIYESSNI